MLIALQIISFPNCAGEEGESSPRCSASALPGSGSGPSALLGSPHGRWHFLSWKKNPPKSCSRDAGSPGPSLGGRAVRPPGLVRSWEVPESTLAPVGCPEVPLVSPARAAELFQLLRMYPHPSSSPSSALGRGPGLGAGPLGRGGSPPHGRMRSVTAAALLKIDVNWLLPGVTMLV